MTRLQAIELLLDELKHHDPERFQQVVCEVLAHLGYADRVDAALDLLAEPERDRLLH